MKRWYGNKTVLEEFIYSKKVVAEYLGDKLLWREDTSPSLPPVEGDECSHFKHYIELVYDKDDIEFYPAYDDVLHFYKIDPSTNEAIEEKVDRENLKPHAFYIDTESLKDWNNRGWVGIYKKVDEEILEGTWFSKDYNVTWEKGDLIECVRGDYPANGTQGDFWYERKE